MMVSIGDLAFNFSNRLSNVRVRTEINSLATELTTGLKVDIRTPLSGDSSPILFIERSLSRLSAYETGITESTIFMAGVQAALAQVSEHMQYLTQAGLNLENNPNPSLLANFARDASSRFEAIIDTLNGSIGGRSFFAGAETQTRPVANASLILQDIKASLPPGASADDISLAVDSFFAPGATFDTVHYLGSDTKLSPFRVSPESNISFGVTAKNTELRASLAASAKVALLEEGILIGEEAEQGALIRQASIDLFGAGTGVVALRADMGVIENRLDMARARNMTEVGALETARLAIVAADPFQTATRLQSVQTQLETMYTLTARLSQLNLTRFLR